MSDVLFLENVFRISNQLFGCSLVYANIAIAHNLHKTVVFIPLILYIFATASLQATSGGLQRARQGAAARGHVIVARLWVQPHHGLYG